LPRQLGRRRLRIRVRQSGPSLPEPVLPLGRLAPHEPEGLPLLQRRRQLHGQDLLRTPGLVLAAERALGLPQHHADRLLCDCLGLHRQQRHLVHFPRDLRLLEHSVELAGLLGLVQTRTRHQLRRQRQTQQLQTKRQKRVQN